MTKKLMLIMALMVALVALVAVPVSAETINGTFEDYSVTQTQESLGTGINVGGTYDFHKLKIHNIEYSLGANAIVSELTDVGLFDAGAPSGFSTPYVAHLDTISGIELFRGTIGYQRRFGGLLGLTELPGYVFLTIEGYNEGVIGLSGNKQIYLEYNDGFFYHAHHGNIWATPADGYPLTNGHPAFVSGSSCSYSTSCALGQKSYMTKDQTFYNLYSATKPSGIGITGSIEKQVNGVTYPSKGYVYDSITHALIASQSVITPDTLSFSTMASSIIIGVENSRGFHINSSILFAPVTSYTLSVNPSTGTINDVFIATAGSSTGSFSDNDAYTIICNSGQVSGTCTYNLDSPTFVRKAGNFWWQKNFTADINLSTTTFPSSVNLRFSAPGTYEVEGTFFETDGGGGTASDTVIIESTGLTRTFTVSAQDSISGALISGATIQIKSGNDTWSNQTTQTGTRLYSTRAGEIIGYGATATDYIQSSILFTQIFGDTQRTVTLNKYIPVAAGNNTLYVYARDTRDLKGIEGALIHLSDGQTKSTPSSGLATFTVIENGTYQITVSKSGFQSLTRTMQVVGSTNAISMELTPLYATTARTLAPGETVPQPTQDTRTNAEKQDSAVKIFFDNIEWIVTILILLIFVGSIKLAKKGW